MKKVEATKASSNIPSIKPRRKFDSAFKRDAVALWLNSGKSAREIGADLGITERHLHTWHRKYAPAPTQRRQQESELEALRRENALLRQQRDILKKTLGILSEPPNSASSGSIS
jgi:transposase